MSTHSFTSPNEELGFFYDTIHGRISLEELPAEFHSTLKAVLASPALNRLKRISQLGHTSLSYFSATHTRFSHALGTMLVMNKLFLHVTKRKNGLPKELYAEVQQAYRRTNRGLGDVTTFIHCHLLLAALYQDVGELPFQKVTSLYFQPVSNELDEIQDKLDLAQTIHWKSKSVFSILALIRDAKRHDKLGAALSPYNLDFLTYLITGDGQPPSVTQLGALRQMVDGGIDADRLDYVYRDASVTIGSLSRPTTVLESITAYRADHVIVSDPRPVVDFLSTRMRLWTFVYSAPDVRFRQALLNTFLQGRLDTPDTPAQFEEEGLGSDLTLDEFLKLDDHTLVQKVDGCCKKSGRTLKAFRKDAARLLLEGTLDYECRILPAPDNTTASPPKTVVSATIPNEMFFDLFRDHDRLQLHNPNGIRVLQTLTESVGLSPGEKGAKPIGIELTSGAMSPMFAAAKSAVLVPKSFFIFRPRVIPKTSNWRKVGASIDNGTLYWNLAWSEAHRALACEADTRSGVKGFDAKKRAVSISYCSDDFPSIVRVVQVLYEMKRRYWLYYRPFDGTGDTADDNSRRLINEAEAVLAIVSSEYLKRAQSSGYINIEVAAMHSKGDDFPVAVLGIDDRSTLNSHIDWDWGKMKERWRRESMVVSNEHKLKEASNALLRSAVVEALKRIDAY